MQGESGGDWRYLEQESRLEEAHRGGEAELHDSMQQLRPRLLPYPVAGEQGFCIRQNCRSAAAQVPVIPCIAWFLCLLSGNTHMSCAHPCSSVCIPFYT